VQVHGEQQATVAQLPFRGVQVESLQKPPTQVSVPQHWSLWVQALALATHAVQT